MAAIGRCWPYFGPHTLAQHLHSQTRWSFRMRAMFVACCLGLLVGVVASPVHARAFCKSKDCQQTSVRKVAPKHDVATAAGKRALARQDGNARKHAATPVHKLAPKHAASAHAPKHAATKSCSEAHGDEGRSEAPRCAQRHAVRSRYQDRLSPASGEVREPRVRSVGSVR